MPRVQKLALDSGHIYAQGAETCLRFRAYLCTGCRNMPQIQGISMHGMQKHASDSGHIYAQGAETCLRFRAYLCPVCIDVPQIQGILLPGVHRHALVFRLIFQLPKRDDTILSHTILSSKRLLHFFRLFTANPK